LRKKYLDGENAFSLFTLLLANFSPMTSIIVAVVEHEIQDFLRNKAAGRLIFSCFGKSWTRCYKMIYVALIANHH
jgi:hypothetical protein